jgi:hypothetical protein
VVRSTQLVLIASACAVSWQGMMAVHEFGHVVGAWMTGGHVERVMLHPFAISRTDVQPNPRPLVVAWAGPIVGITLPFAALASAWRLNRIARDLVRFFTGVCLIANGLYLGIGSFGRIGDAGDLLRHGAEAWQLWFFAVVTVPTGLLLWNGIGPTFGFGRARGRVSLAATWTSAALASVIGMLELILSPT